MIFFLQAGPTGGDGSFLDSPWWNFATLMTKALLVAMWLALVFWTYKDAKRRITDPLMIGVATVTAFVFPYAGTLFYVILRPPEYLEDILERDLEIRAREQELVRGVKRCPSCRSLVQEDFLLCPNCLRKLKERCTNCEKPLDPSWRVCPYCAAEIGTTYVRGPRGRKKIRAEEDELLA